MNITRDTIQGFIDGYVYSGGDPAGLDNAVTDWLTNHPTYKSDVNERNNVVTDLGSYRVSLQVALNSVAAAQQAEANP